MGMVMDGSGRSSLTGQKLCPVGEGRSKDRKPIPSQGVGGIALSMRNRTQSSTKTKTVSVTDDSETDSNLFTGLSLLQTESSVEGSNSTPYAAPELEVYRCVSMTSVLATTTPIPVTLPSNPHGHDLVMRFSVVLGSSDARRRSIRFWARADSQISVNWDTEKKIYSQTHAVNAVKSYKGQQVQMQNGQQGVSYWTTADPNNIVTCTRQQACAITVGTNNQQKVHGSADTVPHGLIEFTYPETAETWSNSMSQPSNTQLEVTVTVSGYLPHFQFYDTNECAQEYQLKRGNNSDLAIARSKDATLM